jgi:hypothetical protein
MGTRAANCPHAVLGTTARQLARRFTFGGWPEGVWRHGCQRKSRGNERSPGVLRGERRLPVYRMGPARVVVCYAPHVIDVFDDFRVNHPGSSKTS